MKKKKKQFHKRAFLNKEGFHSVAAIDIRLPAPGENSYFGSDINISDCSRVINLELDISSVDEIDNTFYKLQALMDVCQAAKEYLAENEYLYIEDIKKKELERAKRDTENKDEEV